MCHTAVSRVVLPLSCLFASIAPAVALAGDQIAISRSVPTLDRWMYPFNASVGTRPTASVFGNWEQYDGLFDNRDAQMIIGFDTASDLSPESAGAYHVISATVTIQVSNEGIVYDTTGDPYQVFLAEDDPDHIADPDPGQPVELYGLDYRSGYNWMSWIETSPFVDVDDLTLPGVRTAYGIAYRNGEPVDISNHAREHWNPQPFATATVAGIAPGEVIPLDSVFRFEIDVENPLIQQYIIERLGEGKLRFAISAMTRVEVQGGTFPLFYCKENIAVELGLASAATLELILEPDASNPCDLNGDGLVDGGDLTILLGLWDTADETADLNEDGLVDGGDLTILLGCWG